MAEHPILSSASIITQALQAARECIQIDRTSLADTSMRPDNTMEPDDAAAVAEYDSVLAKLDEALADLRASPARPPLPEPIEFPRKASGAKWPHRVHYLSDMGYVVWRDVFEGDLRCSLREAIVTHQRAVCVMQSDAERIADLLDPPALQSASIRTSQIAAGEQAVIQSLAGTGLRIAPDVLAAPAAQQGEVVPKLIGWRTENYLWETDDPDKAKNWEPNIGVLPIFEGDPNTKLCAAPQPDVEALRDSAAAKADRIDRLGETVGRQQNAMRAVMSRLAEMLDEDQFAHIEGIVSGSGVTPPQAAQPAALPAGEVTDDEIVYLAGHWPELDPAKDEQILEFARAVLALRPSTAGEVTDAPAEIWLQVNADGSPSDTGYPADHEGVTWCWHSIGGQEARYVRADLALRPSPAPADGNNLLDEVDGARVRLADAVRAALSASAKAAPAVTEGEREQAARDAIESALAALDSAQNGLRWYQEEYPQAASNADGEMHDQISEACDKLNALLPDLSWAAGGQEAVAVFDEMLCRPKLLPNAPMLKHGQKLYTTPQPTAANGQVPEDVRRDAERYRWLTAKENQDNDVWNTFGPYSSAQEIDAAIDAARGLAAPQPKEGQE